MDSRLRALERGAGPQDAARLLHARLRVGRVSRERVKLAAYCGHEAARRALGECQGTHKQDGECWCWRMEVHSDLAGAVRGLERWGQAVCVRACSAAGLRAMGWKAGLDAPLGWVGAIELEALTAAGEWLDDPCDRTAFRCRRLEVELAGTGAVWARRLCVLVGGDPSEGRSSYTHGMHLADACEYAARSCDDDAIRTAISQALTAWALGVGSAGRKT